MGEDLNIRKNIQLTFASLREDRVPLKGYIFVIEGKAEGSNLGDDFLSILREMEEKWQKKWEEAKIFEAEPEVGRPKFFITVAYPYPNSPQHVGHGRTYTVGDVYARFHRMRGYNVLFPMAFHYTGTPIIAMAQRLKDGEEDLIETFREIYHIPEETIKSLTDPLSLARYFHNEIKMGMKEMGYSIDWRREFTTIDRHYNRFITWQFYKLREKGLLVKGEHPVGWCPKCGNAVGQHDTIGDKDPEIEEVVLIKFRSNDLVFPVVTFRPETIFGVTNIWINPKMEYVIAEVDGERWIMSDRAALKLGFQGRKVRRVGKINGSELVGRKVTNPMTGEEIYILPASFVKGDFGTGVVMSVPGHAPYDYLALMDLPDSFFSDLGIRRPDPISIIKVDGYSDLPAKDVVEKLKIKDQNDPKAEDATKEVYSVEYHRGVAKENMGKYSGLSVSKAKERVKEDLIKEGKAIIFYEIVNAPVLCRCGTEVLVKIVRDQWFINYADPEWKRKALEHLSKMRIVPETLRREFRDSVEWLKEKACARRRGLGTRLPWSPDWIIESLSDSTIYMAYYTIVRDLRKIEPENLGEEVFDYIFLGKGDPEDVGRRRGINPKILQKMREEFEYWYPLDSRHSGRDLIWNHLAFFLYNHIAIFRPEHWPKQIVANGSVLMEGVKMSKTLRNIIPLREAVRKYGADCIRAALLGSAEIMSDANFSDAAARSMLSILQDIYEIFRRFSSSEISDPEDIWDKWIISRMSRYVKESTEAYEQCFMRKATLNAIHFPLNDVKFYLRAKKGRSAVMKRVLEDWVRIIAPIIPHMSEELWEMLGHDGFVSLASWPEPSEVYELEEGMVDVVRRLVDDVRSVLNVTGQKPSKLHVYIASNWKYDLMREISEKKGSPSEIIREVMKDEKFRTRGKEVARIVQEFKQSPWTWLPREDEMRAFRNLRDFIEEELGLDMSLQVEDKPEYDPMGRATRSLPGRPAIYIE